MMFTMTCNGDVQMVRKAGRRACPDDARSCLFRDGWHAVRERRARASSGCGAVPVPGNEPAGRKVPCAQLKGDELQEAGCSGKEQS